MDSADYITIYRDLLIETLFKYYCEKIDFFFIKERIEQLFPDKNFYFFQMRDNEQEMQFEWS